MLFSIIMATYNRSELVHQSVQSYLAFIQAAQVKAELIVIDDGSKDQTDQYIRTHFAEALEQSTIKLLPLPNNIGCTAARNEGIKIASGKWLVITDSDDLLDEQSALEFVKLLETYHSLPIIFTRCKSKTSGKLIGPMQSINIPVSHEHIIQNNLPGECMPAIQSEVMRGIPYHKALRAFESLTYAAQLQKFGPGIISPLIVRIYDDAPSPQRLSSFLSRVKRARSMVYGYYYLLTRFGQFMNFQQKLITLIKLICYLPFSLFGRQ